jgi:hypothetical protein
MLGFAAFDENRIRQGLEDLARALEQPATIAGKAGSL